MPSLHFNTGDLNLLFASISAVVLGLMLFMSLRLFASNRRRAYRTLLVSLGFMFTHHLLELSLSLGFPPGEAAWTFAGRLLQTLAFIAVNFAVFELYYRRRPRTRLWFYGLLAIALAVSALDMLPGSGQALAERLNRTPILDGYLLLLAPLFSLMFGPHIGQPRKYFAGMAAAFSAQLCSIAEQHSTSGAAGFSLAAGMLRNVYYGLLFMLLFERVVELLTSAYRSSITDGLTNMYNRRYFVSQLERALRSSRPVGVVFCDIDNFKRLNDNHGHHRADGVLKQIASIMLEETQGTGMAGRYGGEELVAFVTGPSLAGLQLAESIRVRTEKESLVTVSVGFCAAAPGSGFTAETLLKRADQAMYYSKKNGKNRVTDYAALPDAILDS